MARVKDVIAADLHPDALQGGLLNCVSWTSPPPRLFPTLRNAK